MSAHVRITWSLPDGPFVLSEPTERMQLPDGKREGVQCMCAGVLRKATDEDVEMWRKQINEDAQP